MTSPKLIARAAGAWFLNLSPIIQTTLFGSLLVILLMIASWRFSFLQNEELLIQMVAELYGVAIDIFVLSILLVWINKSAERKKEIEQARQLIDDLRCLKGEYVRIRILSCIKTLTRYGIKQIDLNRVKLPNIRLARVDLTASDMNGFECPGGVLTGSRLTGCSLNGAKFDRADLSEADLSFASANGASFNDAFLSKVDMSCSRLITASFRGTNLSGTSFCGAILLGADFHNARLLDVDFRGCKELTIEQLISARLIRGCLFDQELQNVLRKKGIG